MKAVTSEEGLKVYAEALRAGVERGLGAEGLQKMLHDEHGVMVSRRRLLMWVHRAKGAGVEAVTSEGGLEVYAAALRRGVERRLGVEALEVMLLDEYGVTVCGRHPLSTWLDRNRGAVGGSSHG